MPSHQWLREPTTVVAGVVLALVLYHVFDRPAAVEQRLAAVESTLAVHSTLLDLIAQWEVPSPEQQQTNADLQRQIDAQRRDLRTALERLHQFLQQHESPHRRPHGPTRQSFADPTFPPDNPP